MPQRCLDCNKVTLPDDNTGQSVNQCKHCQSFNLVCDHPSGSYSKDKKCFVCSTCGYEYHHELKSLRKYAKTNTDFSTIYELLN